MQRVIAKLFKNGGSRAVRIPAAWGFEDGEVVLSFDVVHRRVIMEQIGNQDLEDFFKLQDELGLQAEEGWPRREQPVDDFVSPFEVN